MCGVRSSERWGWRRDALSRRIYEKRLRLRCERLSQARA
jgi:hypothetical protein